MSFGKRIARLLRSADSAPSNSEKGKALERLIEFMFSSIRGVSDPQKNQESAFGTQEVDLAFYVSEETHFPFDVEVFLAECKNWSSKVNGRTVDEFRSLLRRRACGVGILVATSGVTGDKATRTEACRHIEEALSMDKIKIVVLTRNEIESITSVKELVTLLRDKHLSLVARGNCWPDADQPKPLRVGATASKRTRNRRRRLTRCKGKVS